MSQSPTIQQIKRFVEVYERLSSFEAQHRYMRNWGAFSNEEVESFPDNDVLTVLDWLREQMNDESA